MWVLIVIIIFCVAAVAFALHSTSDKPSAKGGSADTSSHYPLFQRRPQGGADGSRSQAADEEESIHREYYSDCPDDGNEGQCCDEEYIERNLR